MRIVTNLVSALLAQGLAATTGAQDYTLSGDSLPQEGVPKGTVTKHQFANSAVYPGTCDYWVYVPHNTMGRLPPPSWSFKMVSGT